MKGQLKLIGTIFFVFAAIIALIFVMLMFVMFMEEGFFGGVLTLIAGAFSAFGSFAAGALFYGIKDSLENEEAIYGDLNEEILELKKMIENK